MPLILMGIIFVVTILLLVIVVFFIIKGENKLSEVIK
jgi:hypothetical protein